MLNALESFAEEFLKFSKTKPIRIISHYDTDGITSAAIIAKTLKRINKRFSIKIVKALDKEILNKELQRQEREIIFFTDLASGSLKYFKNLKQPIFILDHHEINKKELKEINKQDKIKIINPHLFEEEEVCAAGLCYLFSKEISNQNKDLANLAIIGMIGDRHESNISKINRKIIADTKELVIKKGLLLYPSTRPLKRVLEYSTSLYIPGVTGSSLGVADFLRENNIPAEKSLYELDEKEMSRLITSIMIKTANQGKQKEIIGNLYLLKFFNTKEDVRELSVIINACSRLGHSDIALAFCMENEKIKSIAQEIYTKYKQQIVSALRTIEKLEKIKGRGFIILNAKDEIKDTIIGTVTSILSSSLDYEEGTILIGMAYNKDKIKVSARISGREGRNLKEVLERTITAFKKENKETNPEVGGHHFAAGCLIEREKEKEFINALRKNLEIEIMKI
jgi:RecJ-like exonuclease